MYRALDIFTCIYQQNLCELIVSGHKCTVFVVEFAPLIEDLVP